MFSVSNSDGVSSMNPDPPSAKKRRSRSKNTISPAQREELVIELRRLRSLMQEVTNTYLIRVTAMIQHLVERFEEHPGGYTTDESEISGQTHEQILSAIRQLDVKPQKGRRKDLKRIENLAIRIEDILEN